VPVFSHTPLIVCVGATVTSWDRLHATASLNPAPSSHEITMSDRPSSLRSMSCAEDGGTTKGAESGFTEKRGWLPCRMEVFQPHSPDPGGHTSIWWMGVLIASSAASHPSSAGCENEPPLLPSQI
jgi:hypothetical protein